MKVNLGQAVRMFFGRSSLEMVYFEAIANALDAGATKIDVDITIEAYNQPKTLEIKISDNGVGFTADRYRKFSNLFDVEESSHKGLGRLVYLFYFSEVMVESRFDRTNKRVFSFTENFKEEGSTILTIPEHDSGTEIQMKGYTMSKVRDNGFLRPSYLKNRIFEEFCSRLVQIRQHGKEIEIVIHSSLDNHTEILSNKDIPDLIKVELESQIDLFDKFFLYYSIEEVSPERTSFIAAISVDNRTHKVEIIAQENIPPNHKMIFLLHSDWFNGKVDASRQNLALSDSELQQVQSIFRDKVRSIIEEKIPTIRDRNSNTRKGLLERYPHLGGYFSSDQIGYLSRADVLKKAQEKFFKAQRDILDVNGALSDEQYEKALEVSARTLTEYILFRQITIDKLKSSSKANSEAELHKLFASMQVQFGKEDVIKDLYRNNAWLLDDKYMTYETLLSDRELGELIKFITSEETIERDNDRPDIALVFSNDPAKTNKFDIVIVEIKKRGLNSDDNMKVILQLERRARKLMKYYENRIQRIWYYGIIEINEEVELALSGEYQELYSSGKMYYRETKVAIQKNPDISLPIGVFIWDLDAVVSDASARNSAFLNMIKSKFVE